MIFMMKMNHNIIAEMLYILQARRTAVRKRSNEKFIECKWKLLLLVIVGL